MTSVQTPDWVPDAIFYQIFPDRFARSDKVPKPSNLEPWNAAPTVHGFKGGDLLGVAENLGYLQDLGVTAIYLNPIFQSTANHRYHTHDYFRVDPILGGDQAFRVLLDEAHRLDIRVVLDGVFNHASRGFFQFNHIVENGPASPYIDWFVTNSFPLRPYHAPEGEQGYEAWWNLPALPKLNVRTPAVRDFLLDVACHWIERGVDGWRLDVPGEIDDDEFWREFRYRVKSLNPEAYLVGEIWSDAQRWLQGDQFDAVMNYLFARACLGFFVGHNLLHSEIARTGYHHIEPLDEGAFSEEIGRLLALYPRPVTEVQLNLLGSHDTPRFRTLARDDGSAYRLATLFQMTYPGAPSIYYGDEIGMAGPHDPGCRGAFPWDTRQWDRDLLDYVRRCIALRKSHLSLRRGDFTSLFAGQGVIAFGRKLHGEILIVILNSNRQSVTVDVPVVGYLEEGALLRSVWRNAEAKVAEGRIEGIPVAARSGDVLELGSIS